MILEMTADESGIETKEIGMLKLAETSSPILAFYLDKEKEFGFLMHKNGAFHYFKYDTNEN